MRFGWLGICAGAGTPQPIVDLIKRHVATIVASPEYSALIENGGSMPVSSTPAELGKSSRRRCDEVAATIREFGMQQDRL